MKKACEHKLTPVRWDRINRIDMCKICGEKFVIGEER